MSTMLTKYLGAEEFHWSLPSAGNTFWIEVKKSNVGQERLEAAIKQADPNGTNIIHGRHFTVKVQ